MRMPAQNLIVYNVSNLILRFWVEKWGYSVLYLISLAMFLTFQPASILENNWFKSHNLHLRCGAESTQKIYFGNSIADKYYMRLNSLMNTLKKTKWSLLFYEITSTLLSFYLYPTNVFKFSLFTHRCQDDTLIYFRQQSFLVRELTR